jgi:ABC-type glycerol-3-phosphate transport system substrate-binding protein
MMSDKGAMNVSSMSLAAVMAELAAEKREIYGNAPIPKWEEYDGPWTGTAAYFFFVVPKTTEHPELVKDYLRTFFSDDVYWRYCARTYRGWLPVLLPTQTDPRYLEHPRVKPYIDFFKVGLEVSPGSLAFGQEYGGNRFGGIIDSKGVWIEMIERAVLKNEPSEEIVEWAEEKIKEIVEEYK